MGLLQTGKLTHNQIKIKITNSILSQSLDYVLEGQTKIHTLTKNHSLGTLRRTITKSRMPKQCLITGKKVTVGNNVSHSKRRTKRKLYANLLKRRLLNPATGRYVTVTISTSGLRTLKKWDREGKVYNLAELAKNAL
ncbi:MAG: 50S ribosomal protein L28 [Candidatus Uhrbacteria bacterium GW2011_GWF2_40_263]|nr:MAG: 50S ribosomal protein L28 [Candidatus Uhrbacteria bacterium GW2011_GWF2_40_263]